MFPLTEACFRALLGADVKAKLGARSSSACSSDSKLDQPLSGRQKLLDQRPIARTQMTGVVQQLLQSGRLTNALERVRVLHRQRGLAGERAGQLDVLEAEDSNPARQQRQPADRSSKRHERH